MFRNALKGEVHEASSGLAGLDLLKRKRFGFGALCIFLYVGAEVAIGSLIVNYLMQPHVMALPEQAAGKLIGLYWGGAMIGRFLGSVILRLVSPGLVLAGASLGAIALLVISTQTNGTISGYSLLAVGFANAVMFPTIFTLACEKLGARAADGSGIINVAIVGGAVIPLLTGIIADATSSLAIALVLPMVCYAIICGFGLFARKPA
jgi:FHS family L-fucose permease-like MFS transporter